MSLPMISNPGEPPNILVNSNLFDLDGAMHSTQVNRALQAMFCQLSAYATSSRALEELESIYAVNNHVAAQTRLDAWASGVFIDIPYIAVLDDADMNGAKGAYSAEHHEIYLAKSLVEKDDLTGLTHVFLEEYGHSLDTQFNPGGDTLGDEGELFRWVISGARITEPDLIRLRTENDISFVWVNGEAVVVEQSAIASDFNADNRPDVLWRNSASGENVVWFMGGTHNSQITNHTTLPTVGSSWDAKGITDFNGDGRPDMLWRNAASGENVVWFMGGTNNAQIIGHTALTKVTGNWDIKGIADFNGDNRPDLLWRNAISGENVVWFMGGTNNAQMIGNTSLTTVANSWDIKGITDFNGDNRPDLLWRHSASGQNVVWFMGGTNNTQIIGNTTLTTVPGDWNPLINGWRSNTKPDLKKYWFHYNFNPSNYKLADSYSGSVIAPAGMYTVVPLGSSYVDSDLFDPKISNTEIGLNGKYLVYLVEDYNDDLVHEAGRVFVHNYIDRDNGIEQHIVPYKFKQGVQPAGLAYLGSELDFIDASQSANSRFGQDFYEADPDASSWKAEYFPNKTLSGSPVLIEGLGSGLNFSQNWGTSSPSTRLAMTSIPVDNFSARFTKNHSLAAGFYKIQTTSDDGVQVKIGTQTILSAWVDQAPTANVGYFYWNGGTVPITVEYYEAIGGAEIAFSLTPAVKFQDSVGSGQWHTVVYAWNPQQGSQPSLTMVNTGFNDPNAIGVINLGSNIRTDGKLGLNAQWGAGSPNNDPRLPKDLFAMRSYTQAYFDGSEYKFKARADDGFQILAKQHGTNQWFYISPQHSWEQAYGAHKEYTWKPPAGNYDVHFHMYEGGLDAYIDLAWEKTGYYGNINSTVSTWLSNTTNTNGQSGWNLKSLDEQWDRVSGESAQFGGNFTSGDLWNTTPTEVRAIYSDLTYDIFGGFRAMNTGYLYDQSYRNGYGKWHTALDIQASSGTAIKAVVGGVARLIQSTVGDYFVGINGDDGRLWIYGHLSTTSITVGARVNVGQLIGQTNGQNHLHLEVQNDYSYDPTYGATTDFSFGQAVSISPLQAYWAWRNR